jgi:lysyl-tRNA synthetase class 2
MSEDADSQDHERATASKLAEIMAARRGRIAELREQGIDPYPPWFGTTHTLAELRAEHEEVEAGTSTGVMVTVAGRLMALRSQGKLAFGVIRQQGVDVQLFVPTNAVGDDGMAFFLALDVGDWVGVTGEVMSTNRGELSVRPSAIVLLGKALRPLPDKWHGLKDVEQRYRQREVDLVMNEDARRVFEIRSAVLQSMRTFMTERGFVEVETPMLQPIPGGASARPFVTHHNALDQDMYLRIAPELYLKRLIVGGLHKVFEINRNFRNEGLSPRHNPEFTMFESYEAYADESDVMSMLQHLVERAAEDAIGTTETSYQGRELSLSGPWDQHSLLELVQEATDQADLSYDTDRAAIAALCSAHDIPVEDSWGPGKLIVELYEKLVEPELWFPTIVTEHPPETSPLARQHRDNPLVTERFELIIAGRELANAFSELTDPDDQRARFEAQAAARAGGDEEAMPVDEAYLRAMEYGMPPAGGLGVGVDRLVMLLADVAHIREVMLFPTLRNE